MSAGGQNLFNTWHFFFFHFFKLLLFLVDYEVFVFFLVHQKPTVSRRTVWIIIAAVSHFLVSSFPHKKYILNILNLPSIFIILSTAS